MKEALEIDLSPLVSRHTFNRHASRTLNAALAISDQRGGEYLDSWALPNMHAVWTRHTLKRFGVELTDRQIRLVIMAGMVDVKESRMGGAWKEDTAVDGINYRAAYTGLRQEYEGENAQPPEPMHGPTCTPENCESVAAEKQSMLGVP